MIEGIRYSGSWALPDDVAVYLKDGDVVSIARPDTPPEEFNHVILSGDVFAELKRAYGEMEEKAAGMIGDRDRCAIAVPRYHGR